MAVLAMGSIGVCLVLLPGCSGAKHKPWIQKPKTSKDYLDMALEADSADERRKGVIGLADSRDGQTDWAMKVYDTIARTDVNAATRCAALHAMAPAAGEAQVPTLLKVLSSVEKKHEDVRPAPGAVRWEAAKTLHAVADRGAYTEAQRGEIVQTLIEATASDKDRNVRLTAIDTLAIYQEPSVPPALVAVLAEDDFALRHAAEMSLIALTGHTHDHSAEAWRTWLAETPNPFAEAGQTPPELQTTDSGIKWEWPW